MKHLRSPFSVFLLLALSVAAFSYRYFSQRAQAAVSQPHYAQSVYGQLPLLFEANQGQTDARVKFVARGGGYTLFLRSAEAVLRWQAEEDRTPAVLRLQLVGARNSARARGLAPSATAVNYLRGAVAQQAQAYERVAFQAVWPGIDVVYHGQQRRLEYDFHLQPKARPEHIKLRFTGLSAPPHINEQGELVLNVAGRSVRWRKPVAWQEINQQRRAVACEYSIDEAQQIAFALGAYDPQQPLVIDPALVYSTFLGGAGSETGNAIAVDAAGNAYVCGTTSSLDFPVSNALQAGKDASSTDVFIAKLNAAGTALVYATYLGGSGNDSGSAIAVDAGGNAYVAGTTFSADFPRTAGALQTTLNGNSDGFLVKLNPAGAALVYATLLGGANADGVNGLAVDASGAAYVTGQTDSLNLPTMGATTAKSGAPFFKSSNSGAQWNASANGLTAGSLIALASDPLNASTLYAVSAQGLYKSTDRGAQWSFVGAPPLVQQTRPTVTSFVIDAKTPTTIYLGTTSGVCKSTNSGQSFELKSSGLTSTVNSLALDPQTPATVYAGTSSGVFKTTNGGENWALASAGLNAADTRRLIVDPLHPATLYAGTLRGVFKTTDGAGAWTQLFNGLPGAAVFTALDIDPAAPQTLYAAALSPPGVVYKTTDGGANWRASSGLLETRTNNTIFRTNAFSFAVSGARVLAGTPRGVFLSTDGGQTWALSSSGLTVTATAGLLAERNNPAVIYAATAPGADAFIAKVNAAGAALAYSRYLGGAELDIGRSIAVDASGNAWATGQTMSSNFPMATPTQANYAGNTDIFVTKLNASGAALSFSTYLGGLQSELGYGVRLDGAGNAYVAGWTQSFDFPVVSPLIGTAPGGTDAVVAKFRADGAALEYSTYLGGFSNDQAFALAVDAAGNALIAGLTNSSNFPVINSLQPLRNATGTAFLARLSPNGRGLGFSTYLGGSGGEQINGLALDANGNAYLTGTTASQDFLAVNPLHPYRGASDAFVAKLSPAADLALTLTAAPDLVVFGGNLTYTIRVTNNGELNATGVAVNDVLPTGATFVSATATQGACTGAATVNCNLGNLAAGAAATVTLIIQPPARSPLSNTASVMGNEPDGNAANNRATVESRVTFYDLAVTLAPGYDRAVSGGRVYYLVGVANRSGGTVNNVLLNFTLPAGLSYVNCLPEFGVCGGAGNQRTVAIASLNAGQTRAVTFVATVNNPANVGAMLTANATVTPDAADADRSNNSAVARVTIVNALLQAKSNGKILYDLSDNFTAGVSGLYTINPDGSGQQRLPNLGRSPVWSPDGTRLAYFVREAGAGSEEGEAVFVSAPDGANKRRVGRFASSQEPSRLSWSPDGAQIIFSNIIHLTIANADGSGQTLLTNAPRSVTDPDWSPDGGRIAFVRNQQIWTMNLDGTELKQVTDRANFNQRFSRPRWSPDGTTLLATRNDSEAVLINTDGSGLMRAFNTRGQQSAIWSPDGSKVLFVIYGTLYTINYDGTNLTQLTTPPTIGAQSYAPEWQPLPASGAPQPLPTTPTFTISGRLRNEASLPFNGVLRLSGTVTGVAGGEDPPTGIEGAFTLVRLPRGGNYTLTPESLSHRFEPPSRTYNNLTANVTGADFKAIFRPLAIRGRITDSAGLPMAGAPFTFTAGHPPVETDENGAYAFTNLSGGGDYFLIPLGYRSNFLFEPRAAQFEQLAETKIVNFTGQREQFEVACTVLDAAGQPTPGVTVTLTGANVNRTATTDSNGKATFADVTGGFVYTFKASKTGVSFAPAERRVIVNRPTEVSFYSGAAPAVAVSAASFRAADIALNSIVSVFGTDLAGVTKTATTQPLPVELEGVTATLTGRNFERPCQFFFVSPQQLNLLLPTGEAFQLTPPELLLTIRRNGAVVAAASLPVRRFAPALFTANASGQGVAAAVALRVRADGAQVYEPVARFDAASNRFSAVPLEVGNPAEQVFLILFGTGVGYRFHFRTDLSVKVGAQECAITYAGPQGSLAGLEQVNVLLPPALAGRGAVEVALTTAEGAAANVVQVNLK